MPRKNPPLTLLRQQLLKRRRWQQLGVLATWALLSQLEQPAPVFADEVRLGSADTLQLLGEQGQLVATWAVGAPVLDLLRVGQTVYVACGLEGVLVFDLGPPGAASQAVVPKEKARLAVGRNAVRLLQSGSSLLVIVADYGALSYSLENPGKPVPLALPRGVGEGVPSVLGSSGTTVPVTPVLVNPSAAATQSGARSAPPPAAEPRRAVVSAKVVSVRGGWVAIAAEGPIRPGDRFVIRSQALVSITDPTSGQTVRQPSGEAMGMFAVQRISGTNASGPLPRGTVAHVGDLAEPSEGPLVEPKVAPRLWYGMGRIATTLRPFLIVNSGIGFGLLADILGEYYFKFPLKLGVQVAPLGMSVRGTTGVASEVRARIAFSSSYFEVGIDPGAELHRFGDSQFSLGYSLRLGSLDGLNLLFQNAYVLVPRDATDSSSVTRFSFSSIQGEVNIPVARRFNLHLTGGGSSSWAYGTVGLKYFVRGGGGPGSLILSSGLGGAWVQDSCTYVAGRTDSSVCLQSGQQGGAGPTITVGLDARL